MKILRYYAMVSVISVLAALAMMWLLYRTVVIGGIVALAEHSNSAIAQTALAPVRAALADYLVEAGQAAGSGARTLPLPPAAEDAISSLMRDRHINRIKIYNREGIVTASTSAALVGTNGADNPGFVSAMRGHPLGNIVYRDTFNRFDRMIERANLYESYIPVRRRPTDPVVGVLEIYTDVNGLLTAAERAQGAILAASLIVLTLLYAMLLFIVRHASNTIDAQRRTISEKAMMIERLSQRSQRREQYERKRLAAGLHEGLAQTLSAVKLALEAGQSEASGVSDRELLKSAVPALQEAIRKVGAIAVDLHPPSLDELGLAPSVRALCRQLGERLPSISIEPRISLGDTPIPAALQIVVYRNVDAGVQLVAEQAETSLIRVTVTARNGTLALVVEGNGTEPDAPPGLSNLAGDTLSPLSALRERTMISGGSLSVSRSSIGALMLRASWTL